MWEGSPGFGNTDLQPSEYTPSTVSKKLPKRPLSMMDQQSKSKSQSQCRLLALPMEIKLLIYEMALGSREVHILEYGDATRALSSSYLTRPRQDDGWEEICACAVHKPHRTFVRAGHLLCVCHQMYAELFDLLYSRTKFIFHDPCTLLKFSASLSAPALATIRHIHIDSRFVPDSTRWETPLHHWGPRIRSLHPDAFPLPHIAAKHHKRYAVRARRRGFLERLSAGSKGKREEDSIVVPSTWGACCAALGQMSSLRNLKVSVSFIAFTHIRKQICMDDSQMWLVDHGPAEEFVLRPLEMVKVVLDGRAGEKLNLDVEVGWVPERGVEERERGFEVRRKAFLSGWRVYG